ncbi:Catalase/peroxidase HPI [Phytophthora cinnamomi]|uniref:Catalase/peroxidase HPI n=1 Tax=Phytophthora cinnamomi TaxID=4785 RepID=UPI00355AB41B|nr:Catalase/peroxidase HPI [Phytophthora cinnamomi]
MLFAATAPLPSFSNSPLRPKPFTKTTAPQSSPSTPPTPPPISREAKPFESASAKKRFLDAYLAGQDWLGVAANNAVSVNTAHRITAKGSIEQQPRGGVRSVCIKMTVKVISKLEEYLDEQADMVMAVMKERSAERAVVALLPSKGKNLHVQCDGSPGNGLVLLRTHEGAIRIVDNAPATPRCFSPQKNGTVNGGVEKIISALESVKESYPTLSTTDLVVLAGQVALETPVLLNETWTAVSVKEYKAEGKDAYMMDTDLALLAAPELKEAAQLFSLEEGVFNHLLNSA